MIVFGMISGDVLFYIDNGMLCVLIRTASVRRFCLEHTAYLHVKENRKDILIMPPDLVLWLTLISSNYPYLERSKGIRAVEFWLYFKS